MQMRMLTSLTSEIIRLSTSLEDEINSIKADTLKKHLASEKNSDNLSVIRNLRSFSEISNKGNNRCKECSE